MNHPIRVLIVDDNPWVRDALVTCIDSMSDMAVVAVACDGLDAVAMCKVHQPDIVLMDHNMPGLNGEEATRQIARSNHHVRVIGLSMHWDGPVAGAMMEAGAAAFLPKDGDVPKLLSTIRQLGG